MQEYPYPKYPDFCQGAFYLLHLYTAEKLYYLFQMEFHKNFIWMEDVFLTGKSDYYFVRLSDGLSGYLLFHHIRILRSCHFSTNENAC